MLKLFAALLSTVVLSAPALAIGTADGPGSVSDTSFHMVFARSFGNCTWKTDGTGDNSSCINLAIAAAQADVATDPGTFFRTGTAEVWLPDGNIGISSTILQNTSPAIKLVGAGGPGSFGFCKTQLKWNGAASGTMIQFGDDSTNKTVGGGVEHLCLEGNSVAGYGIKRISASHGFYTDVFIHNTTVDGIYDNPSAIDTNGTADNINTKIIIQQDSVGAANANGVEFGPGTSSNDVFHETWNELSIQYQNGTGIKCGNSDTNWFFHTIVQPINGGTGKSLDLIGSAGGPSNLSECRENYFEGTFGNGTAGTQPVAETNTFPSFDNYIKQMGMGSGSQVPTVNGSATLTYDTDRGDHFSNATNSTKNWVHGGMAYKASPGTANGVLDIQTANGSNFAVGAAFGSTLRVYLQYNQPVIGFNEHWAGGAGWVYGLGSSSSYGGDLTFTTSTGTFTFNATTGTGNAEQAVVGRHAVLSIDNQGNVYPTNHLVLNNLKQLEAKDTGGIARSLLQMDGSNRTVLDGGSGGLLIRDNNSVATIGSSDGSGNFTFNNPLTLSSTINKVTITAPATAATLTLANNKTFTVNNSLTLSGTDSTVMTFPTTSKTIMASDYSNGTTLTANAILTGGGVGAAPNAVALTGLVKGNGASAPTAYAGTSCTNQFPRSLDANGTATCNSIVNADITNSTIDLTTKVTGSLPKANGGTGATTGAGAATNLSHAYILCQASPSASTTSATEVNLAVCTVPANTLGTAGSLRILTEWSMTGSTNAKNLVIRYSASSGSTSLGNSYLNDSTAASGNVSAYCETKIWENGATNAQKGVGGSCATGFSGGATLTGAVDTTGLTYVNINGFVAGGNTLTLVAYTVYFEPAGGN